VSLIGDDDLIGTGALDAGGAGRSTAVRELHIADVEVVIREDRAADGANEDRLVLQAQLLERFGDQLVGDAVPAAGAVMSLLLQIALALVTVVEQRRLGMKNLIARGQDFGSLYV